MRAADLAAALALSLSALTLTACTEPDPASQNSYEVDEASGAVSARIVGPSGDAVTMRTGSGTAIALPAGFGLYPGAAVTRSTMVDGPARHIIIVTMASTDEPKLLADFYTAQAEEAGIDPLTRLTSEEGELLTGRSESMEFAFTAQRLEDVTTATLSVTLSVTPAATPAVTQ